MTFLNYLLMLDSFGVGINFYLKGRRDYRSHLGGFITIAIYITTIVCGVFFSQELFTKTNPTVSTSSMNNPSPDKISYPSETFFILGLSIDSVPFINEKIYRPVAYIIKKTNGSEILSRQNISVEICDKVINKEYKYYELLKQINLSNYYCISLNQNKYGVNINDLYVNEFWGHEGFQMLQMKIFNCTAVAENISECSSDDIIKEKLTSPIITYYTLKNYIDPNNYKHPFVRGLQETFYYVSYNTFISATQYLKNIEVHSDVGLLFSKEEIIKDHTVDSMIEYSGTEQEDGRLFTMSIQLTNKIDIYSRSYFKLQDLGAEIGAVYGALHMVFAFLFGLYNNSKLFSSIINKFFLIKEEFSPLNREKKAFINLKKKFFKDLNLIVSVQRKSFNISHNLSFSKSISDNLSDLNNNITNKNNNNNINNNINDEYIKTSESLNSPHLKDKKIKKYNEQFFKQVLNKKKEEEKKQITINFTYVDRFLCLYAINLCRHKVNKYSYYNLFYKGKDYIIEALDITNYLKYNNFLQMFFLLNGKKTRELYDYVTTPILSTNYVGPRFEVEK